MFLSLVLLVVAAAGELLFGWRPWWRWRRVTGVVVAGLLLVATILSVVQSPGVLSAALVLIGLYALFNIARIIGGHASEVYMRRAGIRTCTWLASVQLLLVVALWSTRYVSITFEWYLSALAVAQLLVAGVVVWSARRQLRTTRLPRVLPEISDGRLPTVTIAVPVRNEEGQLEACLTSLLASNYPKLEILAFDDQSTDRTSEVIRQFAHAGVRFLRSDTPLTGWLAKNQAYDQLAKAASGEVLFFCGADVRVDPQSLRRLTALLENRHKTMLTVLPQNRLLQRLALPQAMRYYWEMAPPRRLFRRPPVLSSSWLIKRQTLEAAGGFAAVRRSVSPEAHIAAYSANHSDGYGFVRSDPRLGVWSEKSIHDQRETALLRRYPQTHRRPEIVLTLAIGQTGLLLAPLLAALIGILAGIWWIVPVALAAFVAHTMAFGAIQRATFTRVPVWRGYAALIPCIALDIWYLHLSMYRYEFTDVAWKGRSVSQAVMRPENSESFVRSTPPN